MDALQTLQEALRRDPGDDMAWLALADSLVEAGNDDRAEMVRLGLLLRRRLDDPAAPYWQQRLLQLWQAGTRPAQPLLTGPFGVELALIPPGSFRMGAQPEERWMDDDEHPRHRVTLTRGFYLGVCQVTHLQWHTAMSGKRKLPRGQPTRPVERLSFDDCRRFCDRMSEHGNRRYRLPSEAEWEYACRAGTTSLFCSGDEIEALRQVGWCSYSGDWDGSGGTRPVGSLRPNAWGLHDMHGNVWEWCHDWYDADYYATSPEVDPTGPAEGSVRVARGGSWRGGPWFCRSAERRELFGSTREINVGFRVAADLDGP